MRSPRLVGHIILGTGLGLALLIACAAWLQDAGTRGWGQRPAAARSWPAFVKCAAGGNRLRPPEACLAAIGAERPEARQR